MDDEQPTTEPGLILVGGRLLCLAACDGQVDGKSRSIHKPSADMADAML